MSDARREGWSTPKFFLIALVVSFVVTLTLNGVLNELLGLGLPSAAFAAADGIILVLVLMPRWWWWKQRFGGNE